MINLTIHKEELPVSSVSSLKVMDYIHQCRRNSFKVNIVHRIGPCDNNRMRKREHHHLLFGKNSRFGCLTSNILYLISFNLNLLPGFVCLFSPPSLSSSSFFIHSQVLPEHIVSFRAGQTTMFFI